MAIQKPQIPGLYITQIIGFLSVFIPISVFGPLGFLTRPLLIVCGVIVLIILGYWSVCAANQKKYAYLALMAATMALVCVTWYLAYHHLCVEKG